MPGWANFLAGLGGGLVVTALGVSFSEWSRRRRARRDMVAAQTARLRALLEDADPRPYALLPRREWYVRRGRLVSARSAEILAPLREAGLLGSSEVNDAAQWVAVAVPHAIWATNEITDAGEPAAPTALQSATASYEQACASVAALENALRPSRRKRRQKDHKGS